MKKKILLLSLTSILSIGAVTALGLSSIKKESFNSEPSENHLQNTFVIDDETSFTPDSEDPDLYYGIALSSGNNSINTKFSGFAKDGDGKLYAPKETVVYFTNVTPINRGFSKLDVHFLQSGTNEYEEINIMTYFSYNELTLTKIFGGGYSDLVTTGSNDNSNYISRTITSSTLSGILNTRYTLFMFYAPFDLYLDSISYETPCIEEVPYVEEANFTDYRPDDKAILDAALGETMPFVGNGSYYMTESYGGMYGFGGAYMSSVFQNTLTNDFDLTYQEMMETEYGLMFQKKVGTEVHTIMVLLHYLCPFNPYEITLTTAYPYMEPSSEWPSDKVSEYLSNSTATIFNTYAPSLEGVSYQVAGQKLTTAAYVQVVINNESNTIAAICNAFYSMLNQIAINNPGYEFEGSQYTGSEPYYDIRVNDEMGLVNAGFSYSGSSLTLFISEQYLSDSFPLEAIQDYLGVTGGIVPFVDANAKYTFSYGTLDIYYTSKASLDNYLTSLENNGYFCYEQYSGNYYYIQSVFASFSVYITCSDIASKGKLTIYFNNHIDSTIYSASSLEEALEELYGKELRSELILDHSYPQISGEHQYRYIESNGYEGLERGVYISGLGQDYIDSLLAGKTYDYYVGGYFFDDTDGSGYYLVLNAYVINDGIFLSAKVAMQNTGLMDSTEANQALHQAFDDRYDYLKVDDPDLYNALAATFTEVPNSNGKKVYMTNELDVYAYDLGFADLYHQALLNNNYSYSKFQDEYHHNNGVTIKRDSYTNSHNVRYYQFDWEEDDSYQFLDFVTYENADLGAIETNFANFPHESGQKLFIKATPAEYDYRVITSDEFEDEVFVGRLIANGFVANNWNERFEKVVDGTSYLVEQKQSCYDSPYYFESDTYFHMYCFSIRNNYYVTSATLFSSLASSSVRSEIKSLVPSFTDDEKVIHSEFFAGQTDTFAFINISKTFDINQYQADLRDLGFELTSTTKYDYKTSIDTYTYLTSSYYVTCQIANGGFENTVLPAYTVVFTYVPITSSGSLFRTTDNPLSFNMRYQDLIVELNDSNVQYYNINMTMGERLSFSLSKDVDIQDYYDALEDAGYKNDGESEGVTRFSQMISDFVMYVSIEKDSIGYRVTYSRDGKDEFNTSKIASFCSFYGFENANPFNTNFSIYYYELTTSNSTSSLSISFHDINTSTLYDYLASDTQYQYEDGAYVKTDANYKYTINISYITTITITKLA